jgi:hypothetical protein
MERMTRYVFKMPTSAGTVEAGIAWHARSATW